MDLREAQGFLQGGFGGGGLTGMALGAGIAGYNSSSTGGVLGAGLAGTVADALVEDVNYTMITDVQIAERTKNHTKVQTFNKATLKQGTSGS